MPDQRALFEVPPATLTDRQTQALDHLKAAGREGLTGAELGALMGVGPVYAKTTGLDLLRALKKKGHARQGRAGTWYAIALPDEQPDASFGDFPEGY